MFIALNWQKHVTDRNYLTYIDNHISYNMASIDYKQYDHVYQQGQSVFYT